MGDATGLEVSRCELLLDQLVQLQVRNRTAQALVLFVQKLQFLELFCAHWHPRNEGYTLRA